MRMNVNYFETKENNIKIIMDKAQRSWDVGEMARGRIDR